VGFKCSKGPSPYELEHAYLSASIRDGKPLNEAKPSAEGTQTGIIGREACYSGRNDLGTMPLNPPLPSALRITNSAHTKGRQSRGQASIDSHSGHRIAIAAASEHSFVTCGQPL